MVFPLNKWWFHRFKFVYGHYRTKLKLFASPGSLYPNFITFSPPFQDISKELSAFCLWAKVFPDDSSSFFPCSIPPDPVFNLFVSISHKSENPIEQGQEADKHVIKKKILLSEKKIGCQLGTCPGRFALRQRERTIPVREKYMKEMHKFPKSSVWSCSRTFCEEACCVPCIFVCVANRAPTELHGCPQLQSLVIKCQWPSVLHALAHSDCGAILLVHWRLERWLG